MTAIARLTAAQIKFLNGTGVPSPFGSLAGALLIGTKLDALIARVNATSSAAGALIADTIAESTAAAGVTADGVLLKDSQVTTDQINEKTSAAGVTVDGCLIKDGRAALLATASMFKSAEVTGNGSAQNTAHGFGTIPTLTYAIFSELQADLVAGADVAEGTHTTTNSVFTVTSGVKYKVIAFK